MAGIIKQDVLRLQVTIDDVEAMQTLQSTKELGCIESRAVDIESLLAL